VAKRFDVAKRLDAAFVAPVIAGEWRVIREVDAARRACASAVATDALKMTAVKKPMKTICFTFILSGVAVYYTPESGQSFAFFTAAENNSGRFLLALANPT
jgi:hypothetical protein